MFVNILWKIFLFLFFVFSFKKIFWWNINIKIVFYFIFNSILYFLLFINEFVLLLIFHLPNIFLQLFHSEVSSSTSTVCKPYSYDRSLEPVQSDFFIHRLVNVLNDHNTKSNVTLHINVTWSHQLTLCVLSGFFYFFKWLTL